LPEEEKIEDIVDEIVEKEFDEDEMLDIAQRISQSGIDYKELHELVLKKIDEKKAKGDY